MLTIRTERQAQEVALVRFIAQPRVGILDDLVTLQIEHRNGLMRQRFLRAVAIIEQRGIASIRTEHHRRRKAVGAANAPWHRNCRSEERRVGNEGRSRWS